MPSRILPSCSEPGCPLRSVEGGGGRCARHKRDVELRRGSSTARGYGRAWQKLRERVLSRQPLCEDCEAAGKVVAGAHVDHRLAKARGGTDDESNLRVLCASCHSRKTATQDGGFGHVQRAR